MFHRPAAAIAGLFLAMPAAAEGHTDRANALFEALRLPEIIEVMSEEGKQYGDEIAEGLFPDRMDADWDRTVSEIYAVPRMQDAVREALIDAAEGRDLEPMIDFLTSAPGSDIMTLEVSARRALLDSEVEEASKEIAALAMMDETPRYAQVTAFIEANDLIEQNVVGAMNGSYAFYTGLLDGGGFPQDLSEEQILTDVWAQEPGIRSSTTEWVYSFLMLAYQPISDEALDEYIAFSKSEAGQQLNAISFAAFDGLYEDISHDLGLAASLKMQGADL